MKKAFLMALIASLTAPAAHSDVIHRIQSSVSLSVDGAGSVANRVPSSVSVSGNNVTVSQSPVLGSLTPGTAVGYTPGAYSVTNAGDAFSYSESYTGGDNTPSFLSTTVTGGVVPALPVFGNVTTTSGGVASTLAGTLDSGGTLTITAGGAGTTAIGQVIQELTIK